MSLHTGSETDETARVERRLTDSQRKRRTAILEAAYEVAHEVPYEEFSTRAVAQRAGVALGTVYHYFATKDHLLAVATLAWVREFDEEMEVSPLRGRSAATRLCELLARQTKRAQAHPELYRSLARSYLSGDSATYEARRVNTNYSIKWFEAALAGAKVTDRKAVLDLLAALSLSTLLASTYRDRDPSQGASNLEAAVRQILRG